MAKGAESKEKIVQKILDTFENSFPYEKEIRIPMVENGEDIEIKVTLTCAKVNVGSGVATPVTVKDFTSNPTVAATTPISEPTVEERENVKNLLNRLGL